MKLTTLSQLESEALMKDRMDAVKGGGGGNLPKDLKCLSCFCPGHEEALQFTTYTAAFFYEIGTEPDE